MIITGTSRGIGKFLAEYYLSKGYKVFGCSRKSGTIQHKNYHHYYLDVSNEQQVIAVVKEIKKTGKISVLINNAGVGLMNHSMLMSLDSVKTLFETNVYGSFLMTREVSKAMMKEKFGRIINFSSVAVPLRIEGEAMYAASKAAVETMTQIQAKELSLLGITINAIAPNPIKTSLIENVPEHKLQALIKQQAIKRYGEFEDIANVIDFLIKPESNFITGQTLYLGGVS